MTPPSKKRPDELIVPQRSLVVPPRPDGNAEPDEPWPSVVPKIFQGLHEVWLQLRGPWSWLVMVPGESGFSTAPLTQGLCQVGSRLSLEPIGFVEATGVDLDSASRLIGQLGTVHSETSSWPTFSRQQFASGTWSAPVRRALVALESPVSNPLALPVALAADGAVLCVRRGRSSVAEVRRTIDAIGQDRIRCCILVD